MSRWPWRRAVATFLADPPPHPRGDLLARHLLCQATGLHDRGPDQRCRDCTVLLDDSAPVCAPAVAYPVAPDERSS